MTTETTTTDRASLLPPLPDDRPTDRHAHLTALLHEFGRHAAFHTITTYLSAPHCPLEAKLHLDSAYNTDEAVDILRTLATLTGEPGRLRLSGPRVQGYKTVRTLEMNAWHGPLDPGYTHPLHVRVEVVIDTTGTEKRHDALLRAARRAERKAATR